MRAIGVDPGSRRIAISAIDVSDRCIEYVNAITIEVDEGELNDRALARVRRSAAAALFTNATEHADTIVTVERVLHAYPREGMSAKMATAMVHTEWIGGLISSAAYSLFGEEWADHVGTCGALEWRRAIVKHRATDHDVAQVITNGIRGWPKRSNAHVRDAAGIALYGAKRWALRAGKSEIRAALHADARSLPVFSSADDIGEDRSYFAGPSEAVPGTV